MIKVFHSQCQCSVPFHESCLNQQLSQVLTDCSTGRTHHEMQDHLPALHSIAVETFNVPCVAVRTQTAALIRPCFAPVQWHGRRVFNSKTNCSSVSDVPSWLRNKIFGLMLLLDLLLQTNQDVVFGSVQTAEQLRAHKQFSKTALVIKRSRRTRRAELSSGCLWTLGLKRIPADLPAAADCARGGVLPTLRHIHHDPCR